MNHLKWSEQYFSFHDLHDLNRFLDIVSVTPAQGSAFGGTRLAIHGEGFGNDVNSISVDISNLKCTIQTVTNSEIVCFTGNSSMAPSIDQYLLYPGILFYL